MDTVTDDRIKTLQTVTVRRKKLVDYPNAMSERQHWEDLLYVTQDPDNPGHVVLTLAQVDAMPRGPGGTGVTLKKEEWETLQSLDLEFPES